MSIEPAATYPPQPSTVRARRTPLSYDTRNNLIAYGSGKIVVVRSVADPEEAFLVYGEHLQPVTTVAFSPSGHYIASGDASGQIRVWNTSGDETFTQGPYQATSARLNGVAWCGESARLMAVGDGKGRYGHVFTADSGNTVGEVSGHSAEVNAVAIKPTRPMRAVSVGEDGNTIFYEGPPFRFARSISKHLNAVSDVAYSPDGKYFVTGGCDRKLGLYDGLSGDFIDWLETGHEGMILSTAFATPTLVLTASADCSVRLTDIESKKVKKIWQLERKLEHQQTGAIAADGEIAVSVGLNGDLYYWKQDSDKPVRIVQGHQKGVSALAVSKSKSALVTGSIDGTVVEWDQKNGGTRIDSNTHEGPVSGLTGDLWSTGWDSKILNVFDSAKSALKTESQPLAVAQAGDYTLTVSESAVEIVGAGKSVNLDAKGTSVDIVGELAVVGFGTKAALYSLPSLEVVHTFAERQAEVSSVRISPDGKYVAIGDASGKILLLSTSDYSIITSRWTFHTSRVTEIAWTQDSKRIVSGALDTNIYIYNVERPGSNIKVLGAHKDGVTQVAWDGDHIVSGGADGSVKRWTVKL